MSAPEGGERVEGGERDYRWRVTAGADGTADISFGDLIEITEGEEDLYLHLLGETLIGIGTRLMGSTIQGDPEWDD